MAETALKSIFVPPYANQGQEFSCHVLWDKSALLRDCRIRVPSGLEFVNVYNVAREHLTTADSPLEVDIDGVRENGYIGFVLKSAILPTPDERQTVEVEVNLVHNEELLRSRHQSEVRLFRPQLKLVRTSGSIDVGFTEAGASPKVTGGMILENSGPGTALVLLSHADSKGGALVDFFESGGEAGQYVSVLKEFLLALNDDYPSHVDLIASWVEFTEAAQGPARTEIWKRLQDLVAKTTKVAKHDPLFVEDLGSVFNDAAKATYAANDLFKSWSKGAEALRGGNLVLLNPWASLRLEPGKRTLSLTLDWFDLLGHRYMAIEGIVLEFRTEGTGLLPLFQTVLTTHEIQEAKDASARPER